MQEFDFLVIGGGAAGYFAAITAKERFPNLKIGILEKNREVLQKVKISGGGRCNVTNSIFEPSELIKNYPRGNAFLLEPFKKFGSKETFQWFEKKGVGLKIEKDGRVFPESNSSQSIIDCLQYEAKGVQLFTSEKVTDILQERNYWLVVSASGAKYKTDKLMIATGSDKRIWEVLKELTFKIVDQAPSLFSFNIKNEKLNQMQGLSFQNIEVGIAKMPFKQSGPMIITHWGLSGPAILKLSAWAARELSSVAYDFQIRVNWIPDFPKEVILKIFRENLEKLAKKSVIANPMFNLTARFWRYICEKSNITEHQKWAETGKKHFQILTDNLLADSYEVKGKSTFKEEFVTAGGIDLDEIDPNCFSSKKYPNLFFAGEVLNIDAVTGGFNFQAAWTGAWHVGNGLVF
jgi:predicted Rossmann fold flavoprotein